MPPLVLYDSLSGSLLSSNGSPILQNLPTHSVSISQSYPYFSLTSHSSTQLFKYLDNEKWELLGEYPHPSLPKHSSLLIHQNDVYLCISGCLLLVLRYSPKDGFIPLIQEDSPSFICTSLLFKKDNELHMITLDYMGRIHSYSLSPPSKRMLVQFISPKRREVYMYSFLSSELVLNRSNGTVYSVKKDGFYTRFQIPNMKGLVGVYTWNDLCVMGRIGKNTLYLIHIEYGLLREMEVDGRILDVQGNDNEIGILTHSHLITLTIDISEWKRYSPSNHELDGKYIPDRGVKENLNYFLNVLISSSNSLR